MTWLDIEKDQIEQRAAVRAASAARAAAHVNGEMLTPDDTASDMPLSLDDQPQDAP